MTAIKVAKTYVFEYTVSYPESYGDMTLEDAVAYEENVTYEDLVHFDVQPTKGTTHVEVIE